MNGNSGKKYVFEGPFDINPDIDHAPAVFAILKVNSRNVKLLDLGGSDILYKGVNQFDRLVKNSGNNSDRIRYAVYYNWSGESVSNEVIAEDIKEFYKL